MKAKECEGSLAQWDCEEGFGRHNWDVPGSACSSSNPLDVVWEGLCTLPEELAPGRGSLGRVKLFKLQEKCGK